MDVLYPMDMALLLGAMKHAGRPTVYSTAQRSTPLSEGQPLAITCLFMNFMPQGRHA
jgi:hypothetical protein